MRATMLRHDRPHLRPIVWRRAERPRLLARGEPMVVGMPYGAPELKAVARDYLAWATLLASALWCVGFVAAMGATQLARQAPVERTVVIVPYREMSAPPPLTQTEAPPQIAVATMTAAPTLGLAVPVPDAMAPPEQTIASQQEIAALTPSAPTASETEQIFVAPPSEEELPKYGEYVFVEELPEAVTRVTPEYPEVARDANVDGTVLVQALVGKDGRVKDVRVVKSIPMLDNAAETAVRKWVFKPALSNNRPVAVWVAIPVRFTLQGR